MNKKVILGIAILVIGIVTLSNCLSTEKQTSGPQIPPPPISSVTSGYIQSYNHELNYGYDYPETWMMRGPDEFQLIHGVQNVEMFVDEPEGTSITIIAKTTDWKNLDEVKNLYKDMYAETIVKENIIEVNGVKGYEMTRLDPPTKSKVVIFIVNGMVYEFMYGAIEDLYDASEEIFDHVVNSFSINFE